MRYQRSRHNWGTGLVTWDENDTVFISVVFSWLIQKSFMLATFYQTMGKHVKIGGPAVLANPQYFTGFDTSGSPNALIHHNPDATFTSRGCIRKCSFCLVSKIEGPLVELDAWPIKPIICDNNLLATSTRHFDRVIDLLLENKIINIDFNQGLDARLLTDHHATRLAELPRSTIIRLALDNIKTIDKFKDAFNKLVVHGIHPNQIRVFVLLGFRDNPTDALYRLELVRSLGAVPNPMRYQPINAIKRNQFMDPAWNLAIMQKIVRYYSRLAYWENIPFEQWKTNIRKPRTNHA